MSKQITKQPLKPTPMNVNIFSLLNGDDSDGDQASPPSSPKREKRGKKEKRDKKEKKRREANKSSLLREDISPEREISQAPVEEEDQLGDNPSDDSGSHDGSSQSPGSDDSCDQDDVATICPPAGKVAAIVHDIEKRTVVVVPEVVPEVAIKETISANNNNEEADEWESAPVRRGGRGKATAPAAETAPPAASTIETSEDGTLIIRSAPAQLPSERIAGDTKFNSSWQMWTHETYVGSWFIDSFHKLLKIDGVKTFWEFHNNFNILGGLDSRYYFLMRGIIEPRWEDINNRNGIMWSFQIPLQFGEKVWRELCIVVLGETLLAKEQSIIVNGLSVARKDQCYIMKIWLREDIANMSADLKRFLKTYVPEMPGISTKLLRPRPEYKD
jgi:hypothetical protein